MPDRPDFLESLTPEEFQNHETILPDVPPGAAPPPAPAVMFGKYRLERVLGKGGMGEVWLATDTTVDRQVALKRPLGADATLLKRLRREAKIVARLDNHAGICRLYEIGEVNGQFYLALGYIKGKTLAEIIEKHETFAPRHAVKIARRVAEILEYAHSRQVLHRDLKPANVMIQNGGVPIVMDFGLSAHLDGDHPLSQSGQLIGTVAYMAPEQTRGEIKEMNPAWDVYSLGVILYEMLTRQRAFKAPNVFALIVDVQSKVPPKPSSLRDDIDPELDAICLKAMAKEAKERYSSMTEFKKALAAFQKKAAGRKPDAGDRLTVRGAFGEMQFAWIPPGSFLMGSPVTEKERDADEKQHRVTLTKGYYMGVHQVTRGQFARFVEASGYKTEAETSGGAYGWTGKEWKLVPARNWRTPGFDQTDDHPVTCISWNDSVALCEWLTKNDKQGRHYRLPTEAEWEYACRAGTTTAFPWGNDIKDGKGWCNIADQTSKKVFPDWQGVAPWEDGYVYTSPVGVFKANAWGLYDVIGNVWEWCQDRYGPYPRGEIKDQKGPEKGDGRVVRGGSWGFRAAWCRAAYRYGSAPSYRVVVGGCRVVLCLD